MLHASTYSIVSETRNETISLRMDHDQDILELKQELLQLETQINGKTNYSKNNI